MRSGRRCGVWFLVLSLLVAASTAAQAAEPKELPLPVEQQETEVSLRLAQWRAELQATKRLGDRWKPWLKDPEYYKGLKTPALAAECFARPTLRITMMVYDDPRFGLEEVRVRDDGFAELFAREDLYQGVLYLFDQQSSRLTDPESDLGAIFDAAGVLETLSSLCTLSNSPLKEQVKGREATFLEAHVHALKAFREYLDHPKIKGGTIGFWTEAFNVGHRAVALLEKVDPPRHRIIVHRLEAMPPAADNLSAEQQVAELRRFLDAILTDVEGR